MNKNKKTHKFTEEDINNIIDLYSKKKLSTRAIARIYNVWQGAIGGLLKRRKIEIRSSSLSNRKYSLNENYFETIDSHEKAYFLGFLYGDGCNYRKQNKITITVAEEDKGILEKFLQLVEYNRPLYSPPIKKNHKKYYFMNINSEKMSKDLEKLGMVNNKTKILTFPGFLENKFYSSFILGLFDSDGSFTTNVDKNKTIIGGICFTGTLSILSTINQIFYEKSITNFCYKLAIDKRCYESFRILRISNPSSILNIYDYLYKDSKLFLPRKKDKIENYLKLRVIF